ncbi:MAG TPA: SagB family peptide dehydrogenase, partial [Acidimicrobiales bacterium]|nr:SagB family peptide dehydrogenase [Acidimicrobiales bacterium]
VLAARRTERTYGAPSLSLAQISALLYFSARTIDVVSLPSGLKVAQRPFASAGGRSELEIYVLSNHVDGLAAGAYHYDPAAHALSLVRRADEWQERITRSAGVAAGGTLNRPPPAVLLITAVFERMNSKYGHLGLSLIYKNVGCLLQSLYLVATALALAPCAIGNGEESANSQWLGLDPLVESQVGCFLVGAR